MADYQYIVVVERSYFGQPDVTVDIKFHVTEAIKAATDYRSRHPYAFFPVSIYRLPMTAQPSDYPTIGVRLYSK